jgi:hypothetical protein
MDGFELQLKQESIGLIGITSACTQEVIIKIINARILIDGSLLKN